MQKAIRRFHRNVNVGYIAVFMLLLRTRSKFRLQVVEHVGFLKTVAIVMAMNSFNLGVAKVFSFYWLS